MSEQKYSCNHCFDSLCMHKVPIFSSLNHEDIIKLAELITHKTYKKGEFILREGEPCESLVIIQEGSTKAYKYTIDGREQILYVFSEGDFFGEQYLISDQVAAFTVEALEPVTTCMLTKSQFRQLLHGYPDIAVKIIEELGSRMSRLEKALQSIGVRNIDARVSGLLLDYITQYGTEEKEGIVIRLPLSREGMANYLGVARETVSRKLGQLENDNIIRSITNKSILVLDRGELEKIAGISE